MTQIRHATKLIMHSLAQICNKNPSIFAKISFLALRKWEGLTSGWLVHLWGRGKSSSFILSPKGVLDNFFVRQVVGSNVETQGGPKGHVIGLLLVSLAGVHRITPFLLSKARGVTMVSEGEAGGREQIPASTIMKTKKYKTIFR